MKIKIANDKYNNLTSKEQEALYDLKNDKNIFIKGADKDSAVVVWDREDYIKEAGKQLGDSDEEVPMKKSLMTLSHLLAPYIEQ